MKRKIISYILIGSLSAVCLCGCGGSNSSKEKETQTVTETAESSKEEIENDLAGSSREETENEKETAGASEADDSKQDGTDAGQNTDAAGANDSGQGGADAGQDTGTAGTADSGQGGQDTGAAGNTDAAGSQNTSTGTADSDALDVSWGVISQYGFNDKNESILSFSLKGSTLVDCGEFYTIEATFCKPVLVSLDHNIGDIVEIVTDELTGERRALTYNGNGVFVDAENVEYYTMDPSASEPVELYCFSDDRVEAAFYEGIIMIAADAESCIDITDEKITVSAELLSEDSWYNGVAFNDKNQAVTLTVYGD